jgi:hypothetical protein
MGVKLDFGRSARESRADSYYAFKTPRFGWGSDLQFRNGPDNLDKMAGSEPG